MNESPKILVLLRAPWRLGPTLLCSLERFYWESYFWDWTGALVFLAHTLCMLWEIWVRTGSFAFRAPSPAQRYVPGPAPCAPDSHDTVSWVTLGFSSLTATLHKRPCHNDWWDSCTWTRTATSHFFCEHFSLCFTSSVKWSIKSSHVDCSVPLDHAQLRTALTLNAQWRHKPRFSNKTAVIQTPHLYGNRN